ncbi:cytochrome c [Meinhardsimonia xiamenensis]|jgi:cytochrome c|uniref:Cytochrome c n=1 Tax=Meinhardsimonia xiamenensis TaxID=990712 RepID=A0A1G9GFX1_9RHOB|nr:c-type cytochrome [Meinhardsimonia xiamenensis]PRX31906.1 cytochrome c [Meinhardsimonia xiamenensis]SDK99579.1 cytochrome c [Meinhardsimonia xiamenensis]
MRGSAILFSLLVAAAGAFPAAAAELIGDAERGRELFRQCSGCHEVGPGARNRIGPHLNGIFGRRAASVDGFFYSKALRRAGADGLVWHLDTLDAYIANPKVLVSGTRMSYRGMKNAEDRADLLAYLRQFSDNPRDIPEADPTAVRREVELAPDVLAIKGDPEYGEYLASECKTCHQASGRDDGIPSITMWPEEDFVIAMHAYKQKLRPHPVMQMIAERLSNEEIAALAAYFATLKEE